MKNIIKRILRETTEEKTQSNFNRLMEKFKLKFPEEFRDRVDVIEKFVVDYIQEHGFTVKFINSCSTGFMGVRTKDQVIICAPSDMTSFGDFLYTIFHEIRHEEQMDKTKMGLDNPLTDYDLEDFEKVGAKYWELEMDADKFAKEMLAKLILKTKLPVDRVKEQFQLSQYTQQYPSMSKLVISQIKVLVDQIKSIKKSGGKYEDIQDHPFVKRHLDKLENFI